MKGHRGQFSWKAKVAWERCHASKRLLNYFIQTKYYVKGNEEVKELRFVHQQMLEYLAAQALNEISNLEQKMVVVALLVLKRRLDSLRFIVTSTDDVKELGRITYFVFITCYMYICRKSCKQELGKSSKPLTLTSWLMTLVPTYFRPIASCSRLECKVMKGITENISEAVLCMQGEIGEVKYLTAFTDLLKKTKSINAAYIEKWMNHHWNMSGKT